MRKHEAQQDERTGKPANNHVHFHGWFFGLNFIGNCQR
jgi:hypothetical protein